MKQRFAILEDDELNLYNFKVIGISCHLKDYKLSWLLNKALNINLVKRANDIELLSKQGKSLHSVFEYNNEEDFFNLTLIKNRSEGLLVSELSNADYFLKLEGEIDLEKTRKRLNEIDAILALFPIDLNKIKSKENFIV